MGKNFLKTDEVAFNLLAEHTCDTCKGCVEKSSNNTCENWEKYVDRYIDIMNKIGSASSKISNNISRGSPNYMVVSTQTAELIKNEMKQLIPEVDTKTEIIENGIRMTAKVPTFAEYITVDFEVKNEN